MATTPTPGNFRGGSTGPGQGFLGTTRAPHNEGATRNIGSLCEQQPLKALRALLADLYLNIKYFIIISLSLSRSLSLSLSFSGIILYL
jgi:hypothetical protein